ncbi:helix-turn-helix transcriptional regulator [Mariprofundus ferrooxydans]|nr:helix-turn-helix transcriptional regulator [Mariprofundus ferrooxydans]
MSININQIMLKNLRKEKAWSQDELAMISGLSLRTIQRIEKDGKASLESKKAIASAFEINASELDANENSSALSSDEADSFYFRIEDGTKLSEIISGACAYRMNHDNPKTEGEAELLASVAQSIQDWGEVWQDLEAGDRVRATFDLSKLIKDLESEGFWVFGLRSDEEYLGIKDGKWLVANVFIMRSDNPKIIKLDLTNVG